MMRRVLAGTLGAIVLGLTVWYAGPVGLIYLALYLLALVPGLPFGWWLFGRTQPVAWVVGALVGYALTALALWIPIRLGVPGPLTFALAWAVLAGAIWWAVPRRTNPLITLPEWSARDTVAWLLVLHLVLALVAVPLGRVGERGQGGTRLYRAYFTADFVWHTALTQELAKFDYPFKNPYLAPEPIHYYWVYFLVPAVIGGTEDAPLVTTEGGLKINATATALLLFSMIFFAAWAASGRSAAAAVAGGLALLAPSLEGLYTIIDFWRRGVPLDGLRELNIDAVTAWNFQGLRIDGLIRSMWYTPQHSTSMALGLTATLAASRIATPARAAWALVGLLLALSVVMNPFLGAAFCAIYGLTIGFDVLTGRLGFKALVEQVITIAIVAAGLAFCLMNGMSEGAGGAVTLGWKFDARHAPVETFLLSFGGILSFAIAGLWPWRTRPWRPAVPGLAGLIVGVFLMYFVTLTDRAWVGFRAGNILLTTLPMLVARGIAGLTDAGWRRTVVVAALVSALAGAPTTLIDAYNAQDIANQRMGPGFLWTIPITRSQQAGFTWLREMTPVTAIVQADPIVRGRQNWSVIPTFAGRRMAAGQPISLLAQDEYVRRSERVHAIITKLSPDEAHAEARRMGIQYLWIDGDDAAKTPAETLGRLAARPDLFATVFRTGDVIIYRVN